MARPTAWSRCGEVTPAGAQSHSPQGASVGGKPVATSEEAEGGAVAAHFAADGLSKRDAQALDPGSDSNTTESNMQGYR